MNIKSSREANVLVLALQGELDAGSALGFDECLEKAKAEREKKILVDLNEVTYISSAGLGVFMSHYKDFQESNTQLTLTGLSEKVLKVFTILGIDSLLSIETNKEEALASFE